MVSKCIICGEEYNKVGNTRRCQSCRDKQKDFKVCEICGNKYKGRGRTCSNSCAAYLRNKLYGSNLDVEKMKQARLKKSGYEFPLQNPELQKLTLENQRKNHNGKLAWNTEKQRQTMIEKYGYSSYMESPEFRKNFSKYNNTFRTISKINLKFSKFLNSNNIGNELEFSILNTNYDFHILDTNILIEINPTYTHNSTKRAQFLKRSQPKEKYYHYNRTKLALENNYICIHKFDWHTNEKILKLIKNIDKYKIVQGQPRLHWYNPKTKKHLRDFDENYNRQEMIDLGYVEIYDDGVRFYNLIKAL